MSGFPPIVDQSWLVANRDEVVLADVRWFLDGRDGRAAYREGHLPGAVFVDLDADLADPPTAEAGRHPLPDPASFAAAMGRLGIAEMDTVVAYDGGPGAIAARLVWMLRALGQDAAILDGGLAAWTGELETGEVEPEPVERHARPWPRRLVASAADVARTRGIVVDARAPERYRGDHEPVDARAGHVPGAVNVPFQDNLGDDGRIRPAEELRERYRAAGVTGEGDTIVYCGSGVTACHDLLALELLGVEADLYVGSWSEWGADESRPVATGE